MVVSAEQIDSIVAAVVQELRDRGMHVGHRGSVAPLETPKHKTAPTQTPPADPKSSGQPEILGKLITLETLRNCKARNCSVRIDCKAVITPAARDELRQRGVKIVRGIGDEESSETPVLFIANSAVQAQMLQGLQIPGTRIQLVPATEAASSTSNMVASAIQTSATRVVCLSEHPFAIAEQLRQLPTVRAAVVRDAAEAAEAIQQADINTFVIRADCWDAFSPTGLVRALRTNRFTADGTSCGTALSFGGQRS